MKTVRVIKVLEFWNGAWNIRHTVDGITTSRAINPEYVAELVEQYNKKMPPEKGCECIITLFDREFEFELD